MAGWKKHDLFEDRICINKFSRHRSLDTENEEEEDNIETGGGGPATTNEITEEIITPQQQPPQNSNKYTPILYTFRIPVGPETKEVKHGYAKCPPFHLQLDHTLAVIWYLFSKKPPTKPLGIAQLQWALNFLKSIKHQNGEQPKDISLCIQAIQDQLLETYAALINEMIDEPIDNENQTEKSTEKKACKVDTCEKLHQAKHQGNIQSNIVIANLPFSVNYVEMMKSSPNTFTSHLRKSLTDAQIQQEIEHLKKATAGTMPDTRLEETRSRDDMLRFLTLWRQEQLEKVQAELKRLHSIENFIENVDKDAIAKKPVKKVSIIEPADET